MYVELRKLKRIAAAHWTEEQDEEWPGPEEEHEGNYQKKHRIQIRSAEEMGLIKAILLGPSPRRLFISSREVLCLDVMQNIGCLYSDLNSLDSASLALFFCQSLEVLGWSAQQPSRLRTSDQ